MGPQRDQFDEVSGRTRSTCGGARVALIRASLRRGAGARGFTLIEMLVVLALTALLSTVVTVSLVGSLRQARIDDTAGAIGAYDRLARAHALRFGRPSRLVVDLTRRTVTRIEIADAEETRGSTLRLPADIQIRRMMTPGAVATAGEVALPVSTNGQTPSYALQLTSAKAGESRWLLVTGLTGRTVVFSNDRDVQEIFRTLAGDADAPRAIGDDAR